MPAEICEHDMVVFVDDLPGEKLYPAGAPLASDGIKARQTGAVLHIHNHGQAYEVEIPLGGGKYATVTVERPHVLKLINVPDSLAASH